jgi:hypothetical protein
MFSLLKFLFVTVHLYAFVGNKVLVQLINSRLG